jgi:hypothetical protein
MNFRGQMILAAENRCLSESEPIPEVGSLDQKVVVAAANRPMHSSLP